MSEKSQQNFYFSQVFPPLNQYDLEPKNSVFHVFNNWTKFVFNNNMFGKKYYNNLRNQQQQKSRNLICRFIEVTTTFKHTGKNNNKAKQKMFLLLILLSIFLWWHRMFYTSGFLFKWSPLDNIIRLDYLPCSNSWLTWQFNCKI